MSNLCPTPMPKPSKLSKIPEQYRTGWLNRMDARIALVRELRDRFELIADDLGGVQSLSYAQRALIERAVWLEYWCSVQERELAAGGEFDSGRWTQACNALSGLFAKLGLHRVAREVPNLQDWIKAKEGDK